jgi:hypothetical protein
MHGVMSLRLPNVIEPQWREGGRTRARQTPGRTAEG